MLFRIVVVCIVLAGGYAAYEIIASWRFFNAIHSPKAAFAVLNEGNQTNLTIVEFLTYDCQNCRDTHKVLVDYAKKNPDTKLVVRVTPMAWGYAEESAEMALAAGLQGKFWEFDDAIIGYDGRPDQKFYRETAALLDLDYERLRKDAKSKKVQEMAANNVEATLKMGLKSVPAVMVGKRVYQLDKPLTLSGLMSMVATEESR